MKPLNQNIECEICHEHCKDHKQYLLHKKTHTQKDESVDKTPSKVAVEPHHLNCNICSKAFNELNNLNLHKKSHTVPAISKNGIRTRPKQREKHVGIKPSSALLKFAAEMCKGEYKAKTNV